MARSLLIRLLRAARDQRGFTLTEQLVVSAGLVVILGAIMGLADLSAKSAPTDRERVHAVREAEVEVDKMVRELRKAHAITIEPFRATARVLVGGAEAVVTYDCTAAPVNGVRSCQRTGGGAPARVVLPRVANATNRPVFTPTQRLGAATGDEEDGEGEDGEGTAWTTYVRVIVEVPSRGERTTGGKARTVFDDGFYLRNVDALRNR